MKHTKVLCVACILLIPLAVNGQPAIPKSIPKLVTQIKPAIVLVCLGKGNSTGFLISKEPPLVATVAHMVSKAKDPSELTIRANETGAVAQVKTIHIHKNFNSEQGGKNPYSTDLAVLELEKLCDGLGKPLILSQTKLGEGLAGEEIIQMGFPYYSTAGKFIKQPEAVLNHSIIQRIVGFNWNTDIPVKERRMMEYRYSALPGDSGSPVILLSSGEVIGVHHGSRKHYEKTTKAIITMSSGAIHVAELRVLLQEKKLMFVLAP